MSCHPRREHLEGLLTREVWLELGTYRKLVSHVFHAGDNLFGAFFFDGTSTRVARISPVPARPVASTFRWRRSNRSRPAACL